MPAVQWHWQGPDGATMWSLGKTTLIGTEFVTRGWPPIEIEETRRGGELEFTLTRLAELLLEATQANPRGYPVIRDVERFVERFIDLIAKAPGAIGGEMEGAGLYVACQQHKVDWIVLKAICDWADGNKSVDKEDRQREAARIAVQFLVASISYVAISDPP